MAEINGTDNDDVIRTAAAGGSLGGLPNATDEGDIIVTGGGSDTVIAGAGNDDIDTGDGADTVDAGDGNDIVEGGDGVDQLLGGDGFDTLDFTNAPGGVAVVLGQGDVFNDGYGNTEVGNFGFENLYGSMNDDPFLAGSGDGNAIFGQLGNDQIYGGGGNDLLFGQAGEDFIVGEEGQDSLYGDFYGGAENDILIGGRTDTIPVNEVGRYVDDLEADSFFGGGGDDTMVIGIDDIAHGEEGNDTFEFAVDQFTAIEDQPLAVGTAAFSGNLDEYGFYVSDGWLYVEHLGPGGEGGTDGTDRLGRAALTDFGGPQLVAFLQFADQTIDVFSIPGVGFDPAPVVEDLFISIDAGGGVGASVNAYDPEGQSVDLQGYTDPANGTLSNVFFDYGNGGVSFTYDPAPGFAGIDSFQIFVIDEFGTVGTGTVTIEVVFDSAVADFVQVGRGRSFTGTVGQNDLNEAGEVPVSFGLVNTPDGVSSFSFDDATGTFSIEPGSADLFSTQFSYVAYFPDGTSNQAPVFIDFVELAETLVGTEAGETINGYGLDDFITGAGGNDTIIGGSGFDTAVFSGVLAGYSLVQTGVQVVVTDIDGSDGDDGTDTVLVEALQFADQTLQVVNNFDPLAGTVDGRLVNGLGGAAGFGENVLFRNDDSSSQAIDLAGLMGGALDFFGQELTQVYVNNNGNLTFSAPFSGYVSQALGTGVNFAIIAGAWSDLDTRRGTLSPTPGGNSTGSNQIFWDLDAVNQTFTATWDDVAAYNQGSSPIATFQLQLVGRGGGDFDIVYRYEYLLDGRVARAGFANQDDTAIFELPGSGSGTVGNLDSIAGNTGLTGVWRFTVRDGFVTPAGAPDAYATNEDAQLVVAGPGVLGNDADPLGRPLAAVLQTNPQHGSIAFNTDGSFTYTPFLDFNGTDSFTYQAVADTLGSGPITVAITVNGVNDAPRNIFINDNTTPENLVSGVNTGAGVTVGTFQASDPESPLADLAFQLIDNAGGRFVLDGRVLKTAGVLDYETATFHDMVVRVTDPQGAFTDHTQRIFVENINEGPTQIFLIDGPGAIYENLPPGTFLGTLATNEAEGDPITYSVISGPVRIVDGEVFTTISFDFEFQTQFSFRIRAEQPGGDGVTNQFTVFVDNLNEAPTALGDRAETVVGEAVTFDVLGNDFDPDGDPLQMADFTNPTNGRLILNIPDETFTYTPNENFIGFDSFTYSVVDPGGLTSETVTVNIVVGSGDPRGENDYARVDEEGEVEIDVLANDILVRPDGSVVSAREAGLMMADFTNPLYGSLILNIPDETFTYRPRKDFYGFDSFTYQITDGFSFSETITVDITVDNVNDDPTQIFIPEFLAVENRPMSGFFGFFDFIRDPDNGLPADSIKNYVGTTFSEQGAIVRLNADFTFDYTPPDDFSGYDSFTFVYNDYAPDPVTGIYVEQGGPHNAVVRINVEGEEPVANDDRYTIGIGQSVSGNVLGNDRSPPGDTPLSAEQAGGSISIGAGGGFTFTGSSSGTFISTYYAIDSEGRQSLDPAILKIVVLPEEPPPPPPGGESGSAWGDPHFVSWDGLYYDMQGWGEFVLARATAGETFEVQVRTRPWVPGAQVTIVEAVAVAIGDHEVMLHLDGSLFVDGVATTLAAGGDPLVLTGNVRLYHQADGRFVFSDNDTFEQVIVDGVGTGTGGYLNVTPRIAAGRADAMEGLLGDNDGNSANDIQLADGTVLAQPVNLFDLYGLFADDWRVTDATSLFTYGLGESTADFQVLNFPPVPLRIADLPTALVAAAAAQVAAAGITDPFLAEAAILDILLTGNDAFIQGAQGSEDPEDGLETFFPPTPPLIGLASPMGDVAEGDAGITTLTFTVFRTGNGLDEVSVDWAAQALGLGYSDAADHGGGLPSGTVTLLAGELEKTFTVDVTGDLVAELNEEVRVGFTSTPAGYTVASGTAQQTVLNDDGPLLPDAVDDAASTAAGTPVVIAPLGNDLDPIGTGISVTAVGAAANGTVQQVGNQIVYTPNAGLSGADSFTYTIGLNGGGSDTATVTVTVAALPPVNTPPVANTDTANGTAGSPLLITAASLLANDTDADGNVLSVTGIAAQGTGGIATFAGGVITYTPNAGFTGADTFAYSVSDGSVTVQGLVNVTVAPATGENTPPVAFGAEATVDEDGFVSGQLEATDADEDAITFQFAGEQPAGFVLNEDGSWSYTPPANIFGELIVQFFAFDGQDQSFPEQLRITITPVNDAPTQVGPIGTILLQEDTPILLSDEQLAAIAGVIDIDGPFVQPDVTDATAGVNLGVTLFAQLVGLTPAANFNGDGGTLDVTFSDGEASITVAIPVSVTAVNDAPANLLLTGESIAENSALGTVVGLLSAIDVDGDPLLFSIVGEAGPFAIVGDQLVVNGAIDFESTAAIALSLRATDPSGAFVDQVVVIDVVDQPEGEAPAVLAFNLFRGSAGSVNSVADWRDPLRNLDYTNTAVPGEQASARPDDSTGGSLARFLNSDGDVAVREADFVGAPSVGPGALVLDWTGDAARLALTTAWNSIQNIYLTEFDGRALAVQNFAMVAFNFTSPGPGELRDYDLTLQGAARVNGRTGSGDDTIVVETDGIGGSVAQNRIVLNTNGGDDRVEITASAFDWTASVSAAAHDPRGTMSVVDLGTGDDLFLGGQGQDIVTGGTGNDTLDGRGGFDQALFAGARSAYAIEVLDAATALTRISHADGVDEVVRFEQLRFDDAVLNFRGGVWA
jgi:VCBS repeat-containing protein